MKTLDVGQIPDYLAIPSLTREESRPMTRPRAKCQAYERTAAKFRLEPWACAHPIYIQKHGLCVGHYKRLVRDGVIGGPLRERRKLAPRRRLEVPA